MALDEVAGITAASGGPCTVRVYQWQPSTVSMGYGQSFDTIDHSLCRRSGIDIVRRPTGGGGIYHDEFGDISYSIAIPARAVSSDLLISYRTLCDPVFDALDSLGIAATFAESNQPALHEPACYLRAIDPAHDIVSKKGGRKICGNAQFRTREAVVQHGSITFARQVEDHLSVFSDHHIDEAAFRDRVTSIRAESGNDRETAVHTLESCLERWSGAVDGEWTADERKLARDIADNKYATDQWTIEREDPYSST